MIRVQFPKLVFFTICLSFILFTLFEAVPQQVIASKELYAASWLGAPVVVQSPQQWKHEYAQKAASVSIKSGAMLFVDDEPHLISLQFIDASYPISGSYKTAFGNELKDGLFIAKAFAEQKNLAIGDQVIVLGKPYIIKDYLLAQDEQVLSPQGLSPSVFISLGQYTELKDQLTSRASWYYYFHDGSDVLSDELVGVKVLDTKSQTGRLGRVILQLEEVLLDIQLLATILVGVVLYIIMTQYHQGIAYGCGVMKVIGLSLRRRLYYTLIPLIPLMLIGLAVGVGSTFYLLNTQLFADLQIDPIKVLLRSGLFIVCYMSMIIAIQQVTMQKKTPLKLIKGGYDPSSGLVLFMILVLSGLLVTSSWQLATLLPQLTGLFVIGGFVYGIFRLMIALYQYVLTGGAKYSLLLLNRVRLAAVDHTMMLMALFLILFASMSIWHIRYQAIDTWQASLPADSPNYFVLGAISQDIIQLKQQYDWMNDAYMYRVVKGQLIAVNGESVETYQQGQYTEHEAFNRQLNLTSFKQLPEHNKMLVGQLDEGISIEQGIMNRLNLKLGDMLTFDILGEAVVLPITSVRQVQWQSLQANFYFVMPKSILAEFPASYIGSVYVNEDIADLKEIAKAYPHIIYINISEYIDASKVLLDQLLNLLSGLLIAVGCAIILFVMLLLFRQLSKRQQEAQILDKLSIEATYLFSAEIAVLVMMASFVSIALMYTMIKVLNLFRSVQWYFDPYSLFMVLGISVMMLLFAVLYDQMVLRCRK
jgi:putative ABC transport system permease protein